GNPLADVWTSGSTFVPGIITNPSFETPFGWTVDPSIGPQATVDPNSPGWATDGTQSLMLDEEVDPISSSTSSSSVSQPVVFPDGSYYVLRFDIYIVAASNGGVDGSNNASFLFVVGNGAANIWLVTADSNITGAHLE